jgi:hypothetical protein
MKKWISRLENGEVFIMKDREVQCEFYICEGNCKKGRAGTFRKACQTCNLYRPLKGKAPARVNNKRKKIEKARERSFKDD